MSHNRVDRRVQRTRQLLHNALLALIAEQGYETITVQNIIDRANVGRSTFYAHYQDKEDLLVSELDDLIYSLSWDVETLPVTDGEKESHRYTLSTLALFRHTQEHFSLYKAMVGGQGIDVVFKTTHTHFCRSIQAQIEQLVPDGGTPSVPPAIMAQYLAGALLTLLTWWLDNHMPYPPEQMDATFQALAMPGVWAVLGIQPDK
ncbi:MAG: TetR/AcrR family transcriptional regulator [Anaerolineaceae bacterium]|nr:TetR/AcrR family transcriptional regulator [Anaerolineaceae bacterium]MCB9098871.1 TetR/AcrR family transcriptional regulator [Anaerolineales bacterium]